MKETKLVMPLGRDSQVRIRDIRVFLEKFGASELAKPKANPAANLFGHVSLMIAAGQVVQKYRQGNKEQAFIEFTSIAAVYLVAQIFLYSV